MKDKFERILGSVIVGITLIIILMRLEVNVLTSISLGFAVSSTIIMGIMKSEPSHKTGRKSK